MKQLTVLVAMAGALTGCFGPINSTSNIIDAEVEIEAARTAGAEKLAPYEWEAARLYLHQAKEEVGYSNYRQGVDFAQKASTCANAARLVSMREKKARDNKDQSPSEKALTDKTVTECYPKRDAPSEAEKSQ
jgi:hypothetical protein